MPRSPVLGFALWLVVTWLAPREALAAVVYVAPSGSDDPNCGLTPQAPCLSLGYAIASVSSPARSTIELADGVYIELGPSIQFGANGITYDLTIRAAASVGTLPTIHRSYNGRLFDFDAGTGAVTFERIRFLRGGWNDASLSVNFAGGLMRFQSSNGNEQVVFTSCSFEGHLNPVKGYAGRGAVAVVGAGAPVFEDCTFRDNWGGIASAVYINGEATPLFERCVFKNSGCFSDGWGGVVVPEGKSAAVWRHCTFRNNTCDYGGAVDDGGTATPRFEDCTFESNYARGLGGAYYGFGDTQSTFVGCTFKENRVPKGGNGQDFYLSSSVAATFDSCTFDAGAESVAVADGASGAVKDSSSLTMRRSVVTRYHAAAGVFHVTIDSRAIFDSTVFSDNACGRGGVVFSERPTNISNCTFSRNSATEGGAILLGGKVPVDVRIQDSHFEGNTAKNNGGAVKATGPLRVTIERSRFVANTAQGIGGGAVFVGADAEMTLNRTVFERNTAFVGGAVWSEGKLAVETSRFVDNTLLHSADEATGDACGIAAGTGGAVYVALPPTLTAAEIVHDLVSITPESCGLSDFFQLRASEFQRNAAENGGGGAVFLDNGVPSCVQRLRDVCADCTFTENSAAYGADVATIAHELTLKSIESMLMTWELMVPVDIVVGAKDHLGQDLKGAHAALIVRVNLSARAEFSAPLIVSLTSNGSRVMRNGEAAFKSLALQLPSTELNNVDTPLNLTLTSDLTALGDGGKMVLSLPITLRKCDNEKGLIRSTDGKCLVEAHGDKQRLIAAVVFSLVLGGFFAFAFYWSYKHSSRVLETLQRLVTGVGASIVRLAFEVLDVISDVQALVNLFIFDANLSNLVFVRAAYVTLFVISLPPSVAVMKATIENVGVQWKRLHPGRHRVVVHHTGGAPSRSGNGVVGPEKHHTAAPVPTNQSEREVIAPAEPTASVVQSPVVAFEPPQPTASSRSAPKWDIAAVKDHLARQTAQLERDLEVHRARSKYMQRVLVRLLTEDILLFVFNIYLYVQNQSDTVFAQSRFRASLEFSILMSAMHFGAQVQNVVAWLHANKVGETKRQLELLLALRKH